MRQAIATLPEDAGEVFGPHWRTLRDLQRSMGAAMKDLSPRLRQFGTNVTEQSRDVEKEWFKAALVQAQDAISAFDEYDAWFRSSGMAGRQAQLGASQEKMRQTVATARAGLASLGDPTSPTWRRTWRHRLDAWVAHNRTHDH